MRDTFRKKHRALSQTEANDALAIKAIAEQIEAILAQYQGREAALAITNLQQAVFWSSMAITAQR